MSAGTNLSMLWQIINCVPFHSVTVIQREPALAISAGLFRDKIVTDPAGEKDCELLV